MKYIATLDLENLKLKVTTKKKVVGRGQGKYRDQTIG